MNNRILIIAIFALMSSGCGEDIPKEETMSVEWYEANNAERAAKLQECKNNPGELRLTPNCVNAKSAQRLSFSKPANY